MKQYALPALVILAALVVLLVVLLGPSVPPAPRLASAAAKPESAAPPPSPASSYEAPSLLGAGSGTPTSVPAAKSPASGSAGDDSVEVTLEQINDAAYTFSPQALPFLEEKLKSRSPEIREAAIESIKILSEPQGIEVLRRAAQRAQTDRERRAMLEAAEWLALPDWKPPQ